LIIYCSNRLIDRIGVRLRESVWESFEDQLAVEVGSC